MKKVLFGAVLLATLIVVLAKLLFIGRVMPRVSIAKVDIGYLSQNQAREKLKNQFSQQTRLLLIWGTSRWQIRNSEIDWEYDWEASVTQALKIGWPKRTDLPLVFTLSENKLVGEIASVSAFIDIPAANPEITVSHNNINVTPGENGQMVDERALATRIKQALANGHYEVNIPVLALQPKLTPTQIEIIKNRAKNMLSKTLTVKFESHTWEIDAAQMIAWLEPIDWKVNEIQAWTEELANTINRPAQNAYFRFINGDKVEEFRPAKPGIIVKQQEFVSLLLQGLKDLESGKSEAEVQVPVISSQPTVKNSDVNSLGIKELVGRGTSNFSGSIPNRVFNVGRAAASINGILVEPDEIFSFTKYIGDISAATGYKSAYVIKDGRTVLGDGGGVCQVSTTLFRAVLNSGLPILERTAHAYRVHYYENDSQPGFDATIFSPSVDFKFKNDTGHYLLLQTTFEEKTNRLTIDFYGTKDGREVTISKARIWDVTPPPPTLYQDDPNLYKGVVQQVDWSAWGTKAAFDWKVTRGGQVLQERTFYSNYRPWQAVFLRGTK